MNQRPPKWKTNAATRGFVHNCLQVAASCRRAIKRSQGDALMLNAYEQTLIVTQRKLAATRRGVAVIYSGEDPARSPSQED
jgi:hypothetical protein